MTIETERARLARDKVSYEAWERDVSKAVEALSLNLTARQWEGIASAQQHRLFAIYDLAERMIKAEPVTGITAAHCQSIRDMCKLPHADLVKKGLLK